LRETWQTRSKDGVHVHILSTAKYKMVTVQASWQTKLSKDTVTALAVLPHVLLRGTEQHPTPEDLMGAFDDLYGASISGRAVKQGDSQIVEFTLQCASEEHLPEAKGLFAQAFELFAQVLYCPALEAGAFFHRLVQTEKTLHRQRIENVINDKMAYASDRCVQVMCEKQPYGIPRSGFVEAVDEMTPVSLFAAYQQLIKQQDLHVYIVGHVDPVATAEAALQALLAVLPASSADEKVEPVRTVAHRVTTRVASPQVVVENMDVSQGKLNMGLATASSYADDDYPALLVYNGILGGFPHSKLFTNVREKASLAYYASSRLEGLKGLIFIQSGIEMHNFDRAQAIIEVQLKDLASGEISDDELNYTKDGLLNQYLLSDDYPLTGAMLQTYGRLSGRERNVQELLDGISAVTREDVIKVAQGVRLDTVYFLRDKEESIHA